MRKDFTINKRVYKPVEFTFNTVCELEDMGLPIEAYTKKRTLFLRSYLALCMGGNEELAGYEIEQHILNGGGLDELTDAINEAMEESDFFRALGKKTEAPTPKQTKQKPATE